MTAFFSGLLAEKPTPGNEQLPENASAQRGQVKAYRVHTDDDPMKEMKVPTSGDQVTRVHF